MAKTKQKTKRRGIVTAVTLGGIALLLWFVVAMLPGVYSEDLTRIGQGDYVLVLVHNKDAVESMATMNAVDSVRREYSDRVEFVVADVNTQRGVSFARQHQARIAELILFGPGGRKLESVRNVQNPKTLRQILDRYSSRKRQ